VISSLVVGQIAKSLPPGFCREDVYLQAMLPNGEEKKSLMNAAESGEALVKLPYLGIWKNIEINWEIVRKMRLLRKISGKDKKIFHYQSFQ